MKTFAKRNLLGLGIIMLLLLIAPLALAQRTTVQLATYGAVADEWSDLIQAFNDAHDDIQLEVQIYPFEEYVDKIMIMVASGTPPDLFQTWAQYKPLWVDTGMLADVTDRWYASEAIADAEIYPFMLEAASRDGRVYGVPFDYNSTVYFVNRDLLAQAGLNTPDENWTVSDLREMGRKVTSENWATYGTNNELPFGWGFNIQWVKNWTGHSWINEAEDQVMVDSPATVELAEWWYENQHQYNISPKLGSYAPRGGGFLGGGYGFYQGWMDVAFTFFDPPAFDWEMALYPAAPGGQANFAQGHMFSMPHNAPNPDASWRVIEWMASYEGQKAMVGINRRQPIGPYMDLWDLYFEQLPGGKGREISAWVLGVLYGQGYAENLDYWATFPQMNDIMREHMARIYNDGRPIQSELADAARRMQQYLDAHNANRQ